jgi:hypothetical protein
MGGWLAGGRRPASDPPRGVRWQFAVIADLLSFWRRVGEQFRAFYAGISKGLEPARSLMPLLRPQSRIRGMVCAPLCLFALPSIRTAVTTGLALAESPLLQLPELGRSFQTPGVHPTNPFGGQYLDRFMPHGIRGLYHRLNQFHGEQGN